MSTIPFVQVEGALALPLIHPLTCLPTPFGREWTLTPPHFSWRAELRALYAAMLRTMCLSAEAIHAAARWSRHGDLVAPGPSPATAHITLSAGANAAARGAYAQKAPTAVPKHLPASDRSKLTGSAVAIGGAALLAWIVASHTPHDSETAANNAKSPSTATGAVDASQRLANARAEHEHVINGAMQEAATQPPSSATVSSHVVDGARTEAVAQPVAITPAQVAARSSVTTSNKLPNVKRANATARAQTDFGAQARNKAASTAKLVQREAHSNGPAHGKGQAVRHTVVQRNERLNANRHQDVHKFTPYREARPLTTHRSHATYSEAKRYSPRQPAAVPADEYASILTYANTYQAPRTSNRPSVAANSTDWVNHVSQRRVTEVPDRFAK